MPPTLVTSDREAIVDFRARHGDIILKPLFGNGGAGVFRLQPDDENLERAARAVHAMIYREPVMVQRYLPAVRQGDKRIILIDGEPVGARATGCRPTGEARANLACRRPALRSRADRARARDLRRHRPDAARRRG